MSELQTQAPSRAWRHSKWLILVELILVVLIYVARSKHIIKVSSIPPMILLAWVSLRLRGLRWRSVGLSLYRNWKITLGWGLVAGLVLEAFQLFVSQPFLIHVLKKPPHLEDFRSLTGNLKMTLLLIVLVWILAAFGEEMVYRGYFMNRVADIFHGTRAAWIISLFVVHIFFGLSHFRQGITGILDEGLAGFLLALLYLRTGRNLAIPIVAHGIQDTIDLILFYLAKYPTL
jgi:membrane protease YdiL (CAAX protease family)